MCGEFAGILPGLSLGILTIVIAHVHKHEPVPLLNKWFSVPRMQTYAYHPDPESLYIWNTRVSKAFLEDIQHVEVLLRNFVDTALAENYGCLWYDSVSIPFNERARKTIAKAKKRAGKTNGKNSPEPGKVIAELSFDFWRFLFIRAYSSTIWPQVKRNLDPSRSCKYPSKKADITLKEFADEIDVVYRLRNRCAHHEPIVRRDIRDETTYLDRAQDAIDRVAKLIDPVAAEWITTYSRVSKLREQKP